MVGWPPARPLAPCGAPRPARRAAARRVRELPQQRAEHADPEHRDLDVGRGDDRGAARLAVEDRQLAEVGAGPDPADLVRRRGCTDRLAFEDDEQRVAGLTFATRSTPAGSSAVCAWRAIVWRSRFVQREKSPTSVSRSASSRFGPPRILHFPAPAPRARGPPRALCPRRVVAYRSTRPAGHPTEVPRVAGGAGAPARVVRGPSAVGRHRPRGAVPAARRARRRRRRDRADRRRVRGPGVGVGPHRGRDPGALHQRRAVGLRRASSRPADGDVDAEDVRTAGLALTERLAAEAGIGAGVVVLGLGNARRR